MSFTKCSMSPLLVPATYLRLYVISVQTLESNYAQEQRRKSQISTSHDMILLTAAFTKRAYFLVNSLPLAVLELLS